MSHPRFWLLMGLLVCLTACDAPSQAQSQSKSQSQSQSPQSSSEPASGPELSQQDAAAPRQNRLARETSPYLLMHANNPVDWYPWGEEALSRAKRENKLIFLSVGYSSCHWCHVMERESFMDPEIAALLNQHYVCIKVDREERPDIDTIYMTAVQLMTRRGGWPMSVFLTPDAKPFFGGTYFPPRDGDRGVDRGFLTWIKLIQETWSIRPDALREDGETMVEALQAELEGNGIIGSAAPGPYLLKRVRGTLEQQFDPEYGGFGYSVSEPRRPKFPEPSNLVFWLDQLEQGSLGEVEQAQGRKQLQLTLDRMAAGGIRDHVGGGFHRYSVDRFWRIPHFEKMLYDNGQLASVYARAYQLTRNDEYRKVVAEIVGFLKREMTAPGGAFYAALDAESEHEEGKFYRWTREEVESALPSELYAVYARSYGLTEPPNFEEKYYAPQRSKSLQELAAVLKLDVADLQTQLAQANQKLLESRAQRERPLTDTKILTSWNGLMIRGLADAGQALQEPEYIQLAIRAARFLLENCRDAEGRLSRTYSQGKPRLNAYLNDYAFLVDGLLGIHQATQDDEWLKAARELTAKQVELFWDAKNGGFFFTSSDHESLLARVKSPFDGAQPSGNSVAAQNLLALARLESQPATQQAYLDQAEATIRAVANLLDRSPAAAPRMAVALAELHRLRPPAEQQSSDNESPNKPNK